jgi:hypothetical protein
LHWPECAISSWGGGDIVKWDDKFLSDKDLLDGEPQSCRDTMLTAMGTANILKCQNPKSKVAVRDLQTGQLVVVTASKA